MKRLWRYFIGSFPEDFRLFLNRLFVCFLWEGEHDWDYPQEAYERRMIFCKRCPASFASYGSMGMTLNLPCHTGEAQHE